MLPAVEDIFGPTRLARAYVLVLVPFAPEYIHKNYNFLLTVVLDKDPTTMQAATIRLQQKDLQKHLVGRRVSRYNNA